MESRTVTKNPSTKRRREAPPASIAIANAAASEVSILFGEATEVFWDALDERDRQPQRDFVDDLRWRFQLEDRLAAILDGVQGYLDELTAAAKACAAVADK